MTLSGAERDEVEQLLESESAAEVVAGVGAFSSGQLHLFMSRYNWDDGLAIPVAVLRHPRCERGTALLIYWSVGGPLSEQDAKDDHRALLEEAKALLLSGKLVEQAVGNDPIVDWQLNKLQLVRLERAHIPQELIRASRAR